MTENELVMIGAKALAANMEAGFPKRARQTWESMSALAKANRYAESLTVIRALEAAGYRIVLVLELPNPHIVDQ